ncbi:hypothetical protein I546_5466 [Mycobacterium kansasii 732]|nr:hypothetical protein I546_5466 [Mycobacterium kansasii 732]
MAKAYPARDLPATAATDARFMTALPTIAALAIALGVGYCFGAAPVRHVHRGANDDGGPRWPTSRSA